MRDDGAGQRSDRAMLSRVRSTSGGGARRSTYKALLVKVDKRFSSRYMFTASYALQSSKSIQDITQNLNDYFATYGPDTGRGIT